MEQIGTFVALSMQASGMGVDVATADDPKMAFLQNLRALLPWAVILQSMGQMTMLQIIAPGKNGVSHRHLRAENILPISKRKLRDWNLQSIGGRSSLFACPALKRLSKTSLNVKGMMDIQEQIAARKAGEAKPKEMSDDDPNKAKIGGGFSRAKYRNRRRCRNRRRRGG